MLDTLQLKIPNRRQDFVCVECQEHGIADKDIIALVQLDEEEYFTTVLKAWRADTKMGKLYPIDPNGIICLNETFGLGECEEIQ